MSNSTCSFSNPILKDRIQILKDIQDRLVFRTYLAPNGGQTELHYHTAFTEKFEVIKGMLCVFLDQELKVFNANESQMILPNTAHRFYNNTDEEVIFDVEIINPGKMKYALQIMYGLAKDGKTNKVGLPLNVFHLAIGLSMMNAYSPNFPQVFQYIALSFLARLGKFIGVEKKLMEKYCSVVN